MRVFAYDFGTNDDSGRGRRDPGLLARRGDGRVLLRRGARSGGGVAAAQSLQPALADRLRAAASSSREVRVRRLGDASRRERHRFARLRRLDRLRRQHPSLRAPPPRSHQLLRRSGGIDPDGRAWRWDGTRKIRARHRRQGREDPAAHRDRLRCRARSRAIHGHRVGHRRRAEGSGHRGEDHA